MSSRAADFNRAGSEEIKDVDRLIKTFNKPTRLKAHCQSHALCALVVRRFEQSNSFGRRELAGKRLRHGICRRGSKRSHAAAGKWPLEWRLAMVPDRCGSAAVPGFSGRSPHTVAFWIRVPSGAAVYEDGPIVSWVAKSPDALPDHVVQIGWNGNPAAGPIGALRTEVNRMSTVGATISRRSVASHRGNPRAAKQCQTALAGATIRGRTIRGVGSAGSQRGAHRNRCAGRRRGLAGPHGGKISPRSRHVSRRYRRTLYC